MDRFVQCMGEKSCADSYICDTPEIFARGAYSLQNAIIIANTIASIDIDLSGAFAGYNLTILCGQNTSCTIHCRATACYNTYLANFDDMNETASRQDRFTVICDANSQLYCPTFINYNQTTIRQNYSLLSDMTQIVTTNENNCNDLNGSYTYDDGQEISNSSGIISNTGNICCRGQSSCAFTTNISINPFNENTKNDIICSAFKSCLGCGSIDGLLNDDTNTHPQPRSSGQIVYNYHYNSSSLFCNGEASCEKSTVRYLDSVYCAGYGSCYMTPMYSIANLYYTGFGKDGAMWEIKGICNIYVLTGNGVNGAAITSDGACGTMNIYFLGYAAGAGARIYCNETDVCNIICAEQGACDESFTQYYCSGGEGNCNIWCNISAGTQYCGNVMAGNVSYHDLDEQMILDLVFDTNSSFIFSTNESATNKSTETVSTVMTTQEGRNVSSMITTFSKS